MNACAPPAAGGFLILQITCGSARAEKVTGFVRSLSPSAVCTYSLGGMFKFDLPTSEASLASVFKGIEASKAELDITDWSVCNMTLEEVFIKLSREIGAQTKE